MANPNRKWALSDDERLLKFSDAGTPLPVIAMTLGRLGGRRRSLGDP